MPVDTLPMRKIRDILRLRFEADLSFEKIARALNLSKGVVSKYLALCKAAGIEWPLPPELDDAALEGKLFGKPGRPRTSTHLGLYAGQWHSVKASLTHQMNSIDSWA